MTHVFSGAAALLFALVLAAPAAAQRDTETVNRSFTLQPGGTLRLTTFSGQVRITGAPGDQVVIKAVRRATRDRLNDIKLDIAQHGNTIEVDANNRAVDRDHDNVVETDFEIQVPVRTMLDIKTFSAPVTIVGVNGSQNIDGFSSRLSVEAREWADGNDLDLHTFSGDITVRLPDSARAQIDFDSFSGEFESDLPVTLTSSSKRKFRGALNGGGSANLKLETFSGDVTIRR